ncbi:MAG: AAA family ATPase [Verrucomicrobia bacterium]|nr:AAA family ATPase [Verrucomicrobiota bacterium]
MNTNPPENFFPHGNRWVRADFHLHTCQDKEFDYKGEPSAFTGEFVDRLEHEGVGVGVITNHNKFDFEEFKSLRKAAKKRGIFLLPGVELSVNDGANGIHALIVFERNAWAKEKDWINPFLESAFHGTDVTDRGNENARCGWSLTTLLEELHKAREKHARDSFVILAHVEDRCGFFNELDGGRVGEFGKQALFRENVLGFQKVRTRDKEKDWKQWLGEPLPPSVEGSDPKDLAKVGQAHKTGGQEQRCFLQIGAHTFEAVKLALLNHRHRVSAAPQEVTHPHVLSIEVEGSGTDGVRFQWALNSGLNNLIGIRGSGKSTVLELLRYGLGVELRGRWTTNPPDETYKTALVKEHVGSGGKITMHLRGPGGKEYEVKRICGEVPKVFQNGQLTQNLRPNGGLLKVLYFGQKDLSELGKEDRNTDLIEKFYSDELREVREKTEPKVQAVRDVVLKLGRQETSVGKKDELLEKKAKVEESLKVFQEHKVADKLAKQVAFNTDIAALQETADWLEELANAAEDLQSEHAETLTTLMGMSSKENPEEIQAAKTALKPANDFLADLVSSVSSLRAAKQTVEEIKSKVEKKREGLDEEFAAVRRQIQLPEVNPDTYVELEKQLRETKQSLEDLSRDEAKRRQTAKELETALTELREAWHEEFKRLDESIRALNERKLPIALELQYRGNKVIFENFLKEFFKGTGVQGATIERLAKEFVDGIDIYQELQKGGDRWKDVVKVASTQQKLEGYIRQKLAEFLALRVPDRLELSLHGKQLARHSLGQRTSALVLFLLERGDYDLLLIDQPEDDLDNQIIYQDVIRRLLELKTKHQFVFATHNANIPVLGESEMVASCSFEEAGLTLSTGSTDHPTIQRDIISVMEGGKDAFALRNRIYEQWKGGAVEAEREN